MVKSILIPLDPSIYTDNAIKFGITLAKVHNAHLTGMVVLDIPGIEKQVGPSPLGASYYAEKLEEKHKKHAQERIDQLLANFKNKCEAAGVRHKEAQNQGSPSERILQESLYYDLVVTGLRTFYHFETKENSGDSLHNLLDEAVTPIFGVPENLIIPEIEEIGKLNVLLPFNGSLQAGRALQRFAQFMRPGMAVPRLVISEDDMDLAKILLNHAKSYLGYHGFTDILTDITTDDIIDACDDDLLAWADAVVVGAHSKHGLFDFMVGSLTKHLIKANKIPVMVGQ